MASKFTGDHDVVIELSETVLTALVSEHLVGVMRFGTSAIRIGKVRVEALGMDPTPRIEIIATVTHGTMRSPNPPLVLRGLRLTLHLRVPVALEVQGTTASIRLTLGELQASDVWWDWEPTSLASVQAQASAQGITWDANTDSLARSLLAAELRTQVVPPIPIPGLAVEPSADAFPSGAPIQVHHLELVSRARDGSSPSNIGLVASFMAPHKDGSATKKTRTLLGNAHQLALGLSPEAVRDGVLCPMLARFFGTTTAGLCPVCGNGTVSLSDRWDLPIVDRVDLTSVAVSCEPGHVRVSCTFDGSGPAFTLSGGLTVLVTFSLETTATGTNLLAHATLEPIQLSLDTNDVLDIFSFGVTQALAELAAMSLRGIAKAKFVEMLGQGPLAQVPLPAPPGGLAASYDSVGVDGDGVWLYARVAVTPRVLPPPFIDLEESMTERLHEVRSGTAGATCARRGYSYVDNDAWQTITVRLVTQGLEPLVSRTWTLSGSSAPLTGGTVSLATNNWGEGADAKDQSVKVEVSFDATADSISLRNDPADGNFGLAVTCVIDDGVDVYTVVESISFDGQPRIWEEAYLRDTLTCMAKTVSIKRHIRWPASDPPGWEYPAPWEERFPGGRGPGWNPPGGPWSRSSLIEHWFREAPGGVVRTASGEAMLRRLLSEQDMATITDADAFRTAPREVVATATPIEAMRELIRDLRRDVGVLPGLRRGWR